jgi:hypothetical protein
MPSLTTHAQASSARPQAALLGAGNTRVELEPEVAFCLIDTSGRYQLRARGRLPNFRDLSANLDVDRQVVAFPRDLRECVADEPDWRDLLRVEEIDLGSADFSPSRRVRRRAQSGA